ncbi:flavin monoamine oxidase family protein [Nocardia takedensis]
MSDRKGNIMPPEVDVVVIGAGVAGLVAARDLVAAGHTVAVLEARDRVGGRLLNAELPGGAPIELGGQWVGPGQTHVLSLISDLGLSLFPTYDSGRHIVELDGRLVKYSGRIPRVSPVLLADLGYGLWQLDRGGHSLPSPDRPLSGKAAELDAQTFESWITKNLRTERGKRYMRYITEAVFAAEPEELSTLWVSAFLAASGGADKLISTKGGAQQDRIVGGSQQIALKLAERLGDSVRLGSAVRGIDWDEDGVRVELADGSTVTGERAILAMPPVLCGKLRYTPELPGDRVQLTERMPMGRAIKINVVYDKPFWRGEGLSGQANSTSRAVGTVFDNTPQGGNPGVLVGFVEGRHADQAALLSPDERRRRNLDDLAAYFGPAASEPIEYLETDWTAEEFTGGCYGAFTGPSTLTQFGTALRKPIGPLHWAGSETARQSVGYMDGAVESGHRAAGEVAALLGKNVRETSEKSV